MALGFIVLVGVIGVYTHLHYWLFLVCFALTFFRLRKTAPVWKGLASLTAIVLLYLPNIPTCCVLPKCVPDPTSFICPARSQAARGVHGRFNISKCPSNRWARAIGWPDLARNLPLVLLVMIPALIIVALLIRSHIKNPRDGVLVLGHELLPFGYSRHCRHSCHPAVLAPAEVSDLFRSLVLLFMAYAICRWDRPLIRRSVALCGARHSCGGAAAFLESAALWPPRKLDSSCRHSGEKLFPNFRLDSLARGYGLLNYYWPQASKVWEKVDVPPRRAPSIDYIEDLQQRLAGRRTSSTFAGIRFRTSRIPTMCCRVLLMKWEPRMDHSTQSPAPALSLAAVVIIFIRIKQRRDDDHRPALLFIRSNFYLAANQLPLPVNAGGQLCR